MLREHNHSAFSLHYELVLVTKNKIEIFTDEIVQICIEIFKTIGFSYQVNFSNLHYEKNHLHFKFEAYPTTNLTKFINAFKSSTSRKLKNKYPEIREKLNGTALWEANYFLMTTGVTSKDMVLHYIEEYIKCDEIYHEHGEECSD
ncbi:IS200/IS605 family transposase [Sneathia sanguinegens]|jgi:hypothetical protein|uniref:IS200/IS605 family transposase n=1 Tax=Sneathia sanguinegens TaxID=40543 RepID=UPI00082B3540|nr:IS200/IS605 family transposase [Sneathia sanguinegens]MDU4652579.1 IS200/IS605 family transposase [Sneathia sanguinegens]MDU7497173.1 IS200/IS605 family transposase [Sneathia sanguinegens]